MLSQNYTDKLDVTMRAAVLASQNPYFEGMNIFVDGFNTFSGSQRMLLKAAAERAELCCFAFVCDKNDPRDIFRTVLADIDALSGGMAFRSLTSKLAPYVTGNKARFGAGLRRKPRP